MAVKLEEAAAGPEADGGGPAYNGSSMAMIALPTSTVAPSGASSAATVPAQGMGNSTSDLAVSISTTMSLTFTTSPTATRQVTISASVRPSPGSGRRNSRTLTSQPLSVRHQTVDGIEHAVEIGEELLLDPTGRIGDVVSADAGNRGLQ
ncbi:MAG: hypothetical protein BWY91_01599 [bacterium ADurb.BinA028]|nr:MAG: hypothetical protein BWY91_01599 [bacterium ADurb.BinA028]